MTFLVEGTGRSLFVGSLFAAILFLLSGGHPALRCRMARLGFWMSALLPFAALGLSTWKFRVPMPEAAVTAFRWTTAPRAAGPSWEGLLLAGWSLSVLVPAARFISDLLTVRRLSRGLSRLAPEPREGASGIELYRATESAVRYPVTVGIWRPIIVLPHESESWQPDAVRAVIAHECAHIRRRDWAHSLAMRVAMIGLWPNFWLRHLYQVATETGELACDAEVLQRGWDPRFYAEVLVDVARQSSGYQPSLVVGAIGQRSLLEARVERLIACARGEFKLRTPSRLPILFAAMAGFAAASLSVVPHWSSLIRHGGTHGGAGTVMTSTWMENGGEKTVKVEGPATIVSNGSDRPPTVVPG